MNKLNLIPKKIKQRFLSINDSLENYFSKLNFIKTFSKKNKILANNRVFFGLSAVLILTLSYFLLPTLYNKDIAQVEIKNQILKKYDVRVKFNYKNQAGRVEYDESTSQARPIYADNDYIFLNTGIDYEYSPNTLLSIEYNKSDFDRRDNGQWGSTNYFSKVEMLKGKSKIIHNGNIVLVGIETKSEQYLGTYAPPNKNSVSEQSFIIQNEFNNENTSILAGLRFDNHEAYGNYTTFKASLNHPIEDVPGLIVKASIGTGFRAPTLGELYGQFNANQSLQPEESLGYEFGFINISISFIFKLNIFLASITSKTLFISVDESIVIFFPIFQLG